MAPDPANADDRTKRLRGLRRKLSKLNRRPLPQAEPPPSPAPPTEGLRPPPQRPASAPNAIVYRRDVPLLERPRVPEGGGICIPLERCVEGREAATTAGSAFYLIERRVAEVEPDSGDLHAALAHALRSFAERPPRAGIEPMVLKPQELLFLDLETTGLGSSPVFLIGTLTCREGDMVARQFLARTYAEEAAILRHYVEQSPERPVVVSFNGKSFDVPYLRVRSMATGVRFAEPRHHFDLLHEARRVYRHRLPDCKLQTLERYVCGRHRGDDIPSADIPRAYHDFVRTGDARELAQIVNHNFHDLVTMVHLMAKMLTEGARDT